MVKKIQQIVYFIVLSTLVWSCGAVRDGADFSLSMENTVNILNATLCANAVAVGELTNTSTNCAADIRFELTLEELSGDCSGANVNVDWAINFTDATTLKERVEYGDINAGEEKTKDVTMRVNDFRGIAGYDENIDFESKCGGGLTGLHNSPL